MVEARPTAGAEPAFQVIDLEDLSSSVPGPAEFHRFYWRCMALKGEGRKLNKLDFALRTIGSSGSAIHATYKLKAGLQTVRDLLGINTASLFPEDENVKIYRGRPDIHMSYLSKLPQALTLVADALNELVVALQGFGSSYHDEVLMIQLWSLHERFRQEAHHTSEREKTRVELHGSTSRLMQKMVQMSLDNWLPNAVEQLISGIEHYHTKGVPTIDAAQNNTISQYLQLTTVATFLAGVTASMLQISSNDVDTTSGTITNTLFLLSLITSVGSAVHSLLLIGWRRAIVGSGLIPLPSLINLWFTSGPKMALLLSASFFSVAICFFSFSSNQHIFTSSLAIAASAFFALGLLFMFIIVMTARIGFRRKAGTLGRILTRDDTTLKILDMIRFIAVEPLKMRSQQSKRRSFRTSIDKTNLAAQHSLPISTKEVDDNVEDKNNDVLLPLLSKDARIPNTLSDEKYLLDGVYLETPNWALYDDDNDWINTAKDPEELATRVQGYSPPLRSSVFRPEPLSEVNYVEVPAASPNASQAALPWTGRDITASPSVIAIDSASISTGYSVQIPSRSGATALPAGQSNWLNHNLDMDAGVTESRKSVLLASLREMERKAAHDRHSRSIHSFSRPPSIAIEPPTRPQSMFYNGSDEELPTAVPSTSGEEQPSTDTSSSHPTLPSPAPNLSTTSLPRSAPSDDGKMITISRSSSSKSSSADNIRPPPSIRSVNTELFGPRIAATASGSERGPVAQLDGDRLGQTISSLDQARRMTTASASQNRSAPQRQHRQSRSEQVNEGRMSSIQAAAALLPPDPTRPAWRNLQQRAPRRRMESEAKTAQK